MSKHAATVVIIGAGPAGLTAALELLKQSTIKPIILEADSQVGGISKTINYKGNHMDLGGHRFFSKSDWVMEWWQKLLPINASGNITIQYHGKQQQVTPNVENTESIPNTASMLVRPRLSRIYFLRRFFDYPLKLNIKTALNLGPVRLLHILVSYVVAQIRHKPEHNLEDFIINRFGKALYLTFFKDYTEKVWGVPCTSISAEWGAQRIKGLSVWTALKHAALSCLPGTKGNAKHTSLIEQFLYPPLGPGQMWEAAADKVQALGGLVRLNVKVVAVHYAENSVTAVDIINAQGESERIAASHIISSMPVQELIAGFTPKAPENIAKIATGLRYRDFITVGVLVSELKKSNHSIVGSSTHLLPDNWIYIQEKEVKLGRLQIFNNWSPLLVKNPDTVWLGLEYFCNEDDELWQMPKEQFAQFAIAELASIGLINPNAVIDWHVVHVPKAYPAYFGSYDKFQQIRDWTDNINNLYLVGRNGMHRYNNQDHSMLTAKLAAEAIMFGNVSKAELWAVNIDDEYHEIKANKGY